VPTLRLTHFVVGSDRHRVEIALEGDGFARRTVTREFEFALSPQDRERLRWYLEEYLRTPWDPAPTIAARVEDRMAEIGAELVQHLFGGDRDAVVLWGTVLDRLSATRVEVATEVGGAGIPWELIRDPTTEAVLALSSRSFVRTLTTPAQPPRLPQVDAGPVRILLAIARPAGGNDVPFRSVAKHIIEKLDGPSDRFEVKVLRPATIGQLERELRQALAEGRPYHIVHFDGHGTYQDPHRPFAIPGQHVFADRRAGRHGYLAFEAPNSLENSELVSGPHTPNREKRLTQKRATWSRRSAISMSRCELMDRSPWRRWMRGWPVWWRWATTSTSSPLPSSSQSSMTPLLVVRPSERRWHAGANTCASSPGAKSR
jgi:CHAT domain